MQNGYIARGRPIASVAASSRLSPRPASSAACTCSTGKRPVDRRQRRLAGSGLGGLDDAPTRTPERLACSEQAGRANVVAQFGGDESEPFAAPGGSLREAEGLGMLHRLGEVLRASSSLRSCAAAIPRRARTSAMTSSVACGSGEAERAAAEVTDVRVPSAVEIALGER